MQPQYVLGARTKTVQTVAATRAVEIASACSHAVVGSGPLHPMPMLFTESPESGVQARSVPVPACGRSCATPLALTRHHGSRLTDLCSETSRHSRSNGRCGAAAPFASA